VVVLEPDPDDPVARGSVGAKRRKVDVVRSREKFADLRRDRYRHGPLVLLLL